MAKVYFKYASSIFHLCFSSQKFNGSVLKRNFQIEIQKKYKKEKENILFPFTSFVPWSYFENSTESKYTLSILLNLIQSNNFRKYTSIESKYMFF